jgi:hypothetical protein
MRSLKPVVGRLLIGLIGVAGCGGHVLVDAPPSEGGAGGVASTGSVNVGVGGSASVGDTVGVTTGPGNASSAVSVGSSNAVSSGSGGMCDLQTCPTVDIMGFITLMPCCPDTNPAKCGLDVTPISGFTGFPPGCMELNRPGNLNPSCPDKLLNLMGMMITLPGCCSGGMCGVMADFSGFNPDLNFGCADASDVTQSCGP